VARLLLDGWRGRRNETAEPEQERTLVNYTHYDYLELAPGASRARIEAAYAALLERFQYGSTDAGQDLSGLVRMIHAAYEVLSDSTRRQVYDAQLAELAAQADRELKVLLDAQAAQSFKRVQDVPPGLAAAVAKMAA
jgi:DnaJ-class molecular chaperone